MASTGVEGDASPGLPVESQQWRAAVAGAMERAAMERAAVRERAAMAGCSSGGRRVLLGHLLDDLQDAVENKQSRVADLVEENMKCRGELPAGGSWARAILSGQAEVRAGSQPSRRFEAEEVEGLKRAIEQKKENIMALFADK